MTTPIDLDAGRYIVANAKARPRSRSTTWWMARRARRSRRTRTSTPDLTRAPKERFIVERPDGFKFRVSVTLPPGYQKGTRLPAIFWFYPREFATQDDYDRGIRTFNKNAAPNFGTRSMQFFVRLGYAVVEPDAPIVGPTGQMNDNYEHDLRNNLAAVIDELDRREIIDRHRLAIGGHSYGAFSTVNAMVHTPFFKAGIAGDGAYNRTLTPLGFQSERRDLWEAKDVYLSMSPFLYAHNLTGALLMYHGLRRPERGHRPDQLDAAVPRAQRPGQDDGAVPLSAGGPRPGDAGNAARPVGALGRVARQVREEPGAAGGKEVGTWDSGLGTRGTEGLAPAPVGAGPTGKLDSRH